MAKLKTNSSAKKRFRITKTGKVVMAQANKRHNMRKRSPEMRRTARGTTIMHAADARIVKQYMPYGAR